MKREHERGKQMKEVIGMAAAAALSIITFLQGIFSGCGLKPEDAESGGTSDNSDKNAAKTIMSEELTLFEYDFNYYGDQYAEGHYFLSLKLAEDSSEYLIRIEAAASAEISGKTDAEALKSLARLIKEQNTASFNGWHKSNTALGSDMRFTAEYASGERISISAEGGVSAAPDIDPVPYISFFDELAGKNGESVYGYSFTDESDESAPKKIKSDTLTEVYCEFYNDTRRNGDGFINGFVWGKWSINYYRNNKAFANHDENCCICAPGKNYFIDISETAADRLGQMFKDMGLEKLNGYNVKDENGGYEYRLGAIYGKESIEINAYGKLAVPEELDFIKILTFLRDYCREAGYDVPPLEGKEVFG